MAQINIGGDQSDPFYRYKRDKIKLQYDAKKGGRTCILNLSLISRQLNVDNSKIDKWMKKKLCTSVKDGIIQGTVTLSQVENCLEEFICKYILCKTCGLPELDKSDVCRSCGELNKKSK